MKQAVLIEPQKVIFQDVPKPEPGPGQVLIQVKRIGVCGSDIHAYYGKHPYISCPVVQGHEFAGRIIEVGPDVRSLRAEDDVTVMPQLVCGECYSCRHGNYHICDSLKVIGCQAEGAAQEFLAVDQDLVIKLPSGMDYDTGAMLEPVAVGAHAIGRLGSVEGKKILVLGAGPIGNLTAQVAAGRGAATVAISDISDYRLEVARRCGIPHTINSANEDLAGAVGKAFGPDGADAILECVGVEETVGQAIALARKGTDIVIVGVFGENPRVNIGLVQDRELRLIGTLMYRVLDYWTAIELIESGKVQLTPLMTRHFPFDRYPEAYRYIEENRERTMKVFIDL
jgi:L-iditol 2-dehydrogenase